MKKPYGDNTQGKEAFTNEIITPIVKQCGYAKASYIANKEKETIWILQDKGNIFYDAVKEIDVTADSCIAMLTDVLINILSLIHI